jgi:DNA mismatch repair ATPase MutS
VAELLVKRIDKGNPKPEDLKAVSKQLDKYPTLYRSAGNLQSNVFNEILRDCVNSIFLKECAERQIEEMKIEFRLSKFNFRRKDADR